jgi:hypothetical protein
MADNAAALEVSAAPPVDAAPAVVATPGEAAKPPEGDGKPKDGEKPAEAAKPNWDAAQKRERKAREAIKAAEQREKDADARAVKAEADAKAEVAALKAKLEELTPILDAMSKKDAKALLAKMELTAVDIATMVAEEGKPPTVEEIEARAVEKATAALREEQKKRDDAATKDRAEREKAEAAEKAKQDDARFSAQVTREVTAMTTALADPANAEKLADMLALDAEHEGLGLDTGSARIEIGKLASGAPWEVELTGGTPSSRAATGLALKILVATGERISPVEALERVQKSVAQKRAERTGKSAVDPKDPKGKQRDQKTNGGAAQPTLSTRSTASAVVEPEEGDRSTVVDEAAVLAAARKVPSLRHLFEGRS